MKKEVKNFIQEFTDNFSELCVEAFMLRYLNAFDVLDLEKVIAYTKDELAKKIEEKFSKKLAEITK